MTKRLPNARGGRSRSGRLDSVLRHPHERRRVRASLRPELLRTADVNVSGVEIASLSTLNSWTPQNPPGNAPKVPHEESSFHRLSPKL